MDVIRTDRLTRHFSGAAAVAALSFTVTRGEIFGLIGPDGAGKTTTLRMLTGILDPTEGDAWVLDRHTVREAEAIKSDIGYMSQRFGLYPDLTVQENLEFYAELYEVPRRGRSERFELLLAFSNLAPFRRRQAGRLSGGMKQKLGLACALVHSPQVLFLDEPTNGVDPVSRRDFWRILSHLLQQGVTIVVTTAYLDEADRCHRVGLLHQGEMIACDTPARLRALMPGALLELRTGQPRLAARLLREQLAGVNVGLFGDRVHLVCPQPAEMETLAQAVLQAAGVAVHAIRAVEPSLEDVFIAILDNGGRGVRSE
jgi:ABC-2 type transport system ATP-binding protein